MEIIIISMVLMSSGFVKSLTDDLGVELKLTDDKDKEHPTTYKFGMHFHTFVVVEEGEPAEWGEVSVTEYGVLLPLELKPTRNKSKQFAVLTSRWRVMSKDRKLERPCAEVVEREFDSWWQ